MKLFIGLGMGMLIGAALGAGAVSELHAQTKNPAYIVAEISPTNLQLFHKKMSATMRASAKAGGGPLIAVGTASGQVEQKLVPLEGKPPKVALIRRWDSMDALMAWWNGPGHKLVQQVGEKYAKYRVYAVRGVKAER